MMPALKEGWRIVEYDDTDWQNVNIADYGYTNLAAQYGEPVALWKKSPLRVFTTPKGEKVVDLGQNIAGR